jgi:hypothetical protein
MMKSGRAALELTEPEPIEKPDHNHRKPKLETFTVTF